MMPKRDPSPKLALLKQAGKKEEPPKLFSKRFQMPPAKAQIKPQLMVKQNVNISPYSNSYVLGRGPVKATMGDVYDNPYYNANQAGIIPNNYMSNNHANSSLKQNNIAKQMSDGRPSSA